VVEMVRLKECLWEKVKVSVLRLEMGLLLVWQWVWE
jgi:hypothetical protein